jgi:hypothetical protein
VRHAVLALVAVLAACGDDAPNIGEDYGNLLLSPAGLVVVEEEHPTGWGRPECFACHEIRNAHNVNRTGLPDCAGGSQPDPDDPACLDLAEVRSIIRNQGEASCSLCHGDNGVPP